jgi:hypothetical protein
MRTEDISNVIRLPFDPYFYLMKPIFTRGITIANSASSGLFRPPPCRNFTSSTITKMRNYKIVPLALEVAQSIKETGKDLFGHDVVEQVATGYGPCRVSLQPFVPGLDVRLLFSHSPFKIDNAFNQPGPVFIHKKEVEPYSDIYRFPMAIKTDKVNFPLTLIGYSHEQRMVFTKLVGDADVDDLIEEIFNTHQHVLYLHARNAEAGCYICKIERL